MNQTKILIVSESDDQHARIVEHRCVQRQVPVRRLNHDSLYLQEISWNISDESESISGSIQNMEDIDVVWNRRRQQNLCVTDTNNAFACQEKEGLYESLAPPYPDVRWVNSRESLSVSRIKLAQLQKAKQFGLRIPKTLVTNDVDALRDFALDCGGSIVAKPIQTQVLSVGAESLVLGTRTLSPEYYASAVSRAPAYVQEKLRFVHELRVVIFGSDLYAFRMTPKVRVDDLKLLNLNQIEHETTVLDGDVANKLLKLIQFYGLEFAAVDMGVLQNGEFVFLEINPNGQWLWLQYMTGFNLLDAFIDFLAY